MIKMNKRLYAKYWSWFLFEEIKKVCYHYCEMLKKHENGITGWEKFKCFRIIFSANKA